jgi:hypothetical protein
MNIAQRHAYGVLPKSFWVCGVRLLPLRLGHRLLLIRSQSPFEGFQCGDEDMPAMLAAALMICSRSVAEGLRLEDEGILEEMSAQWLLRRCVEDKQKVQWDAAVQAFTDYYLENVRDIAPVLAYEDGGRKSDMPMLHALLSALMAEYHYTWEAALECPYSRAMWLYASHLEMNGSAQITDHDAMIEAMRAAEERTDNGSAT